MSATIAFGNYQFDASGTPQWGRRIEFEQQGDGLPRIARSTYTIKQTFEEQSFADNEARIHLLNVAIQAGEGLLVIKDENGQDITRSVAKVRSHNVPESWRQYIAEVTLVLETRELVAATESDATFTPTGGTGIILPNIQEWKQATDTTRFNSERANRKEAIVSISSSGFVLADKALTLAVRRQALQQILTSFQVCNSKDGKLVYAGQENVVKVEKLDGDIADGSERLNWTLACTFKVFPLASGYAEADYTLSTRDEFESGRRIVNIRGNIRAETEQAGKTKAEALRQQYDIGNFISDHADLGDARLSGADGETWVDMTFDFQFSEPIPNVISYDLSVSTRVDVKSDDTIITYQGKVVADNSSDALTQARALGLGKYPLMLLSEEKFSSRKSPNETDERFIELNFSYEYQTKADWKYAEVSREVITDNFGESREVVTGNVAALTETDARNFAAVFKLSGRLMRDQRETIGTRSGQGPDASGPTPQMTRFDFTYDYYLTPASVSVSYGREDRTDYGSSETSTTFSGVARGPSESACRDVITAIVGNGGGGRLAESSRTPTFEKQDQVSTPGSAGAGNQLVSVAFSDRFIGTPVGGPDILQAEFSVKTVFSVNKTVITTIPYGQPFIQSSVGFTPGLRTISGSVTARSQSTAQTWGRGKRSLLGGGFEDPQEEDMTSVNAPFDALNVKQYRFSFTYSARFGLLPFQ